VHELKGRSLAGITDKPPYVGGNYRSILSLSLDLSSADLVITAKGSNWCGPNLLSYHDNWHRILSEFLWLRLMVGRERHHKVEAALWFNWRWK